MEDFTKEFTNGAYRIRVFRIKGKFYFAGIDVAKCLGYKDCNSAVRKIVDDEDKVWFTGIPAGVHGENPCEEPPEFEPAKDIIIESDTIFTSHALVLINESGLWSLVLRSRLPEAKKFKHWITSEVLPSIRKTGSYSTDKSAAPVILSPSEKFNRLDKYIELCTDSALRDQLIQTAFNILIA